MGDIGFWLFITISVVIMNISVIADAFKEECVPAEEVVDGDK
jgi:hypothetical protein